MTFRAGLFLLFLLVVFTAPAAPATAASSPASTPRSAKASDAVTSPAGGEAWQAGTSHAITWSVSTASDVAIDVSFDEGGQWTTLVHSTPAAGGSYAWNVSDVPTRRATVRIRNVADDAVLAQSASVFTIYRAGGGLIAAYPFDGTAEDTSGNQAHGSIFGAVFAEDRYGVPNRAFAFSGFGTSVYVPSLPVALTGDFTVSFWEQSPEQYTMRALGLGASCALNLDFDFNNPDNALSVWLNSVGETAVEAEAVPPGGYTDGAWHHVLVRRSGSDVELYVDGERVGSTEYSGVVGSAGPLQIARGACSTVWWRGTLDDIAFYNRALAEAEIASLSEDRPALNIVRPFVDEDWRSGSVGQVSWVADPSITEVDLEYSLDHGATWTGIVAGIPASPGSYAWTLPDIDGRPVLLRISGYAKSIVSVRTMRSFWGRDDGRHQWQQVTGNAAFEPRDGAGAVTFDGYMWLLGGWNGRGEVGNDVWRSRDGRQWEFVAKAPWPRRHAGGATVHDGKMWIVSGDGYADVWHSTDGVHWTRATGAAPWGRRYKPYVVSFDGKLWLMGGLDLTGFSYQPLNDVWNSVDGENWTRVVEHAPWTPRGIVHGEVVFNGRIWLLGGGTYGLPPTFFPELYYNDVWSSADGITWELETDGAPWPPRIHHNTVVYADRMWVMAGHDDDLLATGAKNDVWTSTDGRTWNQLPGTPWSRRHASSMFVHDDAMWMVAGFLVNDVWKLQLPGTIAIDDGALVAATPNVTLTLTAPTADVVEVELSNDGVAWSAAQPYAGTVPWTLDAGDGVKTVHVRYRNNEGDWTQAFTDTIVLSAAPYVHVRAPSGGEDWLAGSTQAIEWVVDPRVAAVRIEYSTDGGSGWTEVAAAAPASTGRYDWIVPDVAHASTLIRVTDAGGSAASTSQPFWIYRAAGDGLLAHYPLDGDGQDAGPNAIHGTVHGATPTADRLGRVDSAMLFDDVGERIQAAAVPAQLDGDFTVAFWASSAGLTMEAIGLGTIEGANLDFLLSGSSLTAYWNGSEVNLLTVNPSGASAFADGGWHHVALTRSGDLVRLYVDGTSLGTRSYVGRIGGRGPLTIGQGSFSGRRWNGRLDDLRIYRRALSGTEVAALQKTAQSIDFVPPGAQVFQPNATVLVAATATSGLPVTFVSATPAVCSVAGDTVTLLRAGTCTLHADQTGNAFYAAAPQAIGQFSIAPGPQSITFEPAATLTYGGAPFALTATSTSGLPVSFASTTPSVCTVAGTQATMLGAGTCTVTASQGGDADYAAATPVVRSIEIAKADQTVLFAPPASVPFEANGTFALSATGGGATTPVVFASTTPANCTVAGHIVTMVARGTCALTADQAGDANYNAAPQVVRQVAIDRLLQTIAFPDPGAQVYATGATIALSATATSGLPVAYGSNTPSVCSVTGQQVSILSVGTCTLTADQAGDADYAPAVQAVVSVTIAKASQTIDFPVLAARRISDGPQPLAATATSALPVAYDSLTADVCAIVGSTAALLGNGTCRIRASQPGDANHFAAAPVEREFDVSGGTIVALRSSLNPVDEGRALVLTADVSGIAPTGTVRFRRDAIDIAGCTDVPVAGSGDVRTAECSVATLAPGVRQLTATYSGDGSNVPATSAPLAQTVNALPTIVVPANASIREDEASTPFELVIGDAETPADDLTVTATSSSPSLITDASLAAGLAGSGAQRTLIVRPVPDAFGGPVTITVHVADENGASRSADFALTVEPVNDRPSFTLLPSINHATGAVGVQQATVATAISVGPSNESGQTPAFTVSESADAIGVVDAASIGPDGVMTYTLSGKTGVATLRVELRDDGGTARGGIDATIPAELRIAVGDGISLAIEIVRTTSPGESIADMAAGGSTLVSYRVRVHNVGNTAVPSMLLRMPPVLGLVDVLWTCSSPGGACTPAQGSGGIATMFALPVGAAADIDIAGGIDLNSAFVELDALVELPPMAPALDTRPVHAVLIERASPAGVFKAGFE